MVIQTNPGWFGNTMFLLDFHLRISSDLQDWEIWGESRGSEHRLREMNYIGFLL